MASAALQDEFERDYQSLFDGYVADVLKDREQKKYCKWVRLAIKRHVKDLKRSKKKNCEFYFDLYLAFDVCDFAEKLPHVEGTWDSSLIVLEKAQIFILASIFGWRLKANPDIRRFNTAYLEFARKNAKSVLASIIGLYCQTCEKENGPQVKSAATTGDQGKIVFGVAKKMVEATPDLQSAFGLQTFAESIVSNNNNGTFKPINAKSSTQDGLNPHCTIIDELHAHKDRSLFDVLRSARGARKNPLSLYITTAGYFLEAVCYEQRTQVVKILEGIFDADHFFGIIYTIDDNDDPFDESVWCKANPLLGVSVQLKELAEYAKEAQSNPRQESEFKTKRLNVWCNAANGWIGVKQWGDCGDESLKLENFLGEKCWIGCDLADADDTVAKVRMFVRGNQFYFFPNFYLPRESVMSAANRTTDHYLDWYNKGLFELTDGNITDYARIEHDIRVDVENFEVRKVYFDQFGSGQISSNLCADEIDAVIMYKNAKNFTDPCKLFEAKVRAKEISHPNDPCLNWQVTNAVVTQKVDGSLLPKKETEKSKNKIDGLDAIINCIAAYMTDVEVEESNINDVVGNIVVV